MVAIPATPHSSQAPDPAYNVEQFTYNEKDNTYTCPQGHTLTTNGTWHKTNTGSRFQQYKTKACKTCPVRDKCTKAKKNNKIVQRRLYAANIEANRERIERNPETYRKRQAIVEHPYGTIKRQWGFSYVTTKKYLSRACADIGLMMIAYNIKRIINLVGADRLKEYFEYVNSLITDIYANIAQFWAFLMFSNFRYRISQVIFNQSLNSLYLIQK